MVELPLVLQFEKIQLSKTIIGTNLWYLFFEKSDFNLNFDHQTIVTFLFSYIER